MGCFEQINMLFIRNHLQLLLLAKLLNGSTFILSHTTHKGFICLFECHISNTNNLFLVTFIKFPAF